jgi:hypothetical protein
MCVQRVLPRSYLLLGLAISTAITFGSAFEAQAQADFNIQSRLNTFTTPLVLSPDIATPSATPSDPTAAVFSSFSKGARNAAAPKGGACIKDKDFVLLILKKLSTEGKLRYMPEDLQDLKSGKDPRLAKPEDAARILNHILSRLNDSQDGAILQWLKDPQPPKGSKKSQDVGVALSALPVSFCDYSPPPTGKVSSPFNPSLESNVLKSNTNVQADRALGYGGTAQVTAAGFRPYDVMGLSIGSASAGTISFPRRALISCHAGRLSILYQCSRHINYNYKDRKMGCLLTLIQRRHLRQCRQQT